MHIRNVVGALLVGAITIVPASVSAQSSMMVSNTKGFFGGLELSGNSIKGSGSGQDDFFEEQDTGGGFGLQLGYGFTPALAIFARLNGAGMTTEGTNGDPDVDYSLGQFDIGGRFNFANPARKLVPYVELAFTGIGAVAKAEDVGTPDDLELSGTGFTGGGGVHYFFSPKFAFNAALAFTSGTIKEVKSGDITVDVDESVTTSRLSLGLTWFPMARR